MKYTLAALAVTTMAANAAVVTTSYGTVTDGVDDSDQAGPMWGQTIVPDTGASPVGPHGTLYLTNFQYQAASNGGGATGIVYLHAYDSVTVETANVAGEGTITALGNLVAVSNSTVDLSGLSAHANMSWDFTGNVAFTANDDYFFVMSTGTTEETLADHSDFVTASFDLNVGNPYSAGGTFAANSFASNSLDWDQEFLATWSTTPVPEPSSTALLGLGGLALILRRRK
ncbi:MAG: PEP-CTERM sorting domain-containing protein [Akkermansiaceae bacterium]